MHWKNNAAPMRALLLAFALSVTACATKSPPTLQVEPIRIPSPPAAIEPTPSGTYWTKHCALLKTVRETLKIEPPKSGPCWKPGPAD